MGIIALINFFFYFRNVNRKTDILEIMQYLTIQSNK